MLDRFAATAPDRARTLAWLMTLLTDRWVSRYPDAERRAAFAWYGAFARLLGS